MSTEVLDGILESFRTDLIEYINDETFDMLNEFTDEEIADNVISIAKVLMVRDFTNGHIIKGRLDYLYKINNNHKGFVSVSNDSETGVSRTEYFPFYADSDGYFAGLCNLASMINEAWYLCNN